MDIPKEITLAGIPIKTIFDDKLIKDHNIIGKADYEKQEIVIDISVAPKETTEQAYVHELVHYILYIMGQHDLRNDEAFVDLFAHLLYQARRTAK